MIEKGHFVWYLSDECIVDLGEIDANSWEKIKENVRIIMAAKQTSEIGMAYIAAFLIYMNEMQMLSDDYDSKIDKFH